MTNLTVKEINEMTGGFLISIATDALEPAAEKVANAKDERQRESALTAKAWLTSFSSEVSEAKAEEALDTLDHLPASATMRITNLLMKQAARQVWSAYSREQRGYEEELYTHLGDAERPVDEQEEYAGTQDSMPSLALVRDLAEGVHMHMSVAYLRAQQSMFGRKTRFNAYRFNEFPVGWTGSDKTGAIPHGDFDSYLRAVEISIGQRQEQDILDHQEARRTQIDMSKFH